MFIKDDATTINKDKKKEKTLLVFGNASDKKNSSPGRLQIYFSNQFN